MKSAAQGHEFLAVGNETFTIGNETFTADGGRASTYRESPAASTDDPLVEKDGWWGGILVQFAPEVDGHEANVILEQVSRKIERQNRGRVVKASSQGPTSGGRRDA